MDKKQQDFIILRADGLSFDKIAKKLKVSKPTLIQWSKLLEDEIKDVQFHAFISIKETYSWNIQKKYETLLKQLDKIDEYIISSDFSQTSLKDLFTIKNDLLFKIENIERKVKANPKVTQTNDFGIKEELKISLDEIN